MSTLLDSYPERRDVVAIPTIVIWIVLSILVHVAILLWAPRLRMASGEKPEPPPMTVFLQPQPQIVPPSPAEPAPEREVMPPPKAEPPPPPPKAKRRAEKAPAPVIALNKPPEEPRLVVPAPPPAEAPSAAPITPKLTTPPPAESDLAAYIEARRRARGEAPADASAAEAERANRSVLANAALKPSAPLNLDSQKPTPSGGLFQIRRRGYDYAEFMFYGWNENFRRQGPQLIEVRKENHRDIDIAVVRKIIEIIRSHERGDFNWHSKRSGKTFTLSARARDNASLEEFMMQEFYEDLHRYR